MDWRALDEQIRQELFGKVKPVSHLCDFTKYLGAVLGYKPDLETVFVGHGWELSFDMLGERITLDYDHVHKTEFVQRFNHREITNAVLNVGFDFYDEEHSVEILFKLPVHQDLLTVLGDHSDSVPVHNAYYVFIRNILWKLKQTEEKRAKYLTPPKPEEVLANRSKEAGK